MSDIVERLRQLAHLHAVRPEEHASWEGAVEIERLRAEVERLTKRLEIDPHHPYDGIYCRDATISSQDKYITRLRTDNERLRAALEECCRKHDEPITVFDIARAALKEAADDR